MESDATEIGMSDRPVSAAESWVFWAPRVFALFAMPIAGAAYVVYRFVSEPGVYEDQPFTGAVRVLCIAGVAALVTILPFVVAAETRRWSPHLIVVVATVVGALPFFVGVPFFVPAAAAVAYRPAWFGRRTLNSPDRNSPDRNSPDRNSPDRSD